MIYCVDDEDEQIKQGREEASRGFPTHFWDTGISQVMFCPQLSNGAMPRADAIAAAVLEEFDKLPANCKPVVRTNGVREWVPLSGIVAECCDGQLMCLALATGMKCLPASRLPSANGVGIHDSHAEVLALRAFNRFVLQECHDVLLHGQASQFLRLANTDEIETQKADEPSFITNSTWNGQLFVWRDNVALHMYCSEAPCGDASMELIMAEQDDTSPWTVPSLASADSQHSPSPLTVLPLAGRGYFSQLGTVRRKPGRGDAPPTLSKSCSDKLALHQCTTLLSGLTSLFVAPCAGLCLRLLVLPRAQYTETGCRRCFSAEPGTGRMHPVADRSWPGGYAFTALTTQTTTLEFAYSRRRLVDSASLSSTSSSFSPVASSNLSVAWTRHGMRECLVGGVLRGRRAFAHTGASAMSRRRMWRLAREVVDAALGSCCSQSRDCLGQVPEALAAQLRQLCDLLHGRSYNVVKGSNWLAARRRVKEDVKRLALRGWTSNDGDAEWGLDS